MKFPLILIKKISILKELRIINYKANFEGDSGWIVILGVMVVILSAAPCHPERSEGSLGC